MTAPATGIEGPAPQAVGRRRWLRGQRDFWRQFARHRDGVFGVVVLIFFSILAIAPQLFVGPLETVTTSSGVPARTAVRDASSSAPTSSAATSST